MSSTEDATAGDKRKAQENGDAETQNKAQKTLEESFQTPAKDEKQVNGKEESLTVKDQEQNDESNKDSTNGVEPEVKGDSKANGATEESADRKEATPSSIIEKGIIYFFTRGRVEMDEPESVSDLARTYFVMRPMPRGVKLGDGPIEDSNTNRLFALPKKVFPKSKQDRFMAFVEKAQTSMKDLKDSFFAGSDYSTQTSGTRHTPAVTPVGEGVYAITHTDRSTHLAYMLTIPKEPSEVQTDLGLRSQGSFVISVKNPERSGPASAQLPQKPKYPKEVLEEFRGLAWAAVQAKFIEYENTQILLIGEGDENSLGKATEQTEKDDKHNKETPQQQLEELEHEDELRVQHLHGEDSVYDDLKVSKKDLPDVLTTW